MFKLGLKSLYPHLYYTTMHIFFIAKSSKVYSQLLKTHNALLLTLVATLHYHTGLILLSASLLLWNMCWVSTANNGTLPVEKKSLLSKSQEARKSKRFTGPLPKVIYGKSSLGEDTVQLTEMPPSVQGYRYVALRVVTSWVGFSLMTQVPVKNAVQGSLECFCYLDCLEYTDKDFRKLRTVALFSK